MTERESRGDLEFLAESVEFSAAEYLEQIRDDLREERVFRWGSMHPDIRASADRLREEASEYIKSLDLLKNRGAKQRYEARQIRDLFAKEVASIELVTSRSEAVTQLSTLPPPQREEVYLEYFADFVRTMGLYLGESTLTKHLAKKTTALFYSPDEQELVYDQYPNIPHNVRRHVMTNSPRTPEIALQGYLYGLGVKPEAPETSYERPAFQPYIESIRGALREGTVLAEGRTRSDIAHHRSLVRNEAAAWLRSHRYYLDRTPFKRTNPNEVQESFAKLFEVFAVVSDRAWRLGLITDQPVWSLDESDRRGFLAEYFKEYRQICRLLQTNGSVQREVLRNSPVNYYSAEEVAKVLELHPDIPMSYVVWIFTNHRKRAAKSMGELGTRMQRFRKTFESEESAAKHAYHLTTSPNTAIVPEAARWRISKFEKSDREPVRQACDRILDKLWTESNDLKFFEMTVGQFRAWHLKNVGPIELRGKAVTHALEVLAEIGFIKHTRGAVRSESVIRLTKPAYDYLHLVHGS